MSSNTSTIFQSTINNFLDTKHTVREFKEVELIQNAVEIHSNNFLDFIDGILKSPLWIQWDFQNNPLKQLALDLAAEIDRLSTLHPEPAFHSRRHFMDVCMMLSYLLMQQERWCDQSQLTSPWYACKEEKWLLLIAAISHDLGHPGLINKKPYELEKGSLDLLDTFLSQSMHLEIGISDVLGQISPWILATDHAYYKALLEKVSKKSRSHVDCMSMLLVEADLASSVLPNHGFTLAQRLAEEWRINYPEKSMALTTHAGYLQFLKSLSFVSPQSIEARIPQALQITLSTHP